MSEGGREPTALARRVAACGVLHNPFAGKPPIDDFSELIELSAKAGGWRVTPATSASGVPGP